MPNYTTDPVTGILIPIPGSDPGPDYADQISDALLTLAHLTHTGVSNTDGYQIPAAGIDFDDDISAQNHNLTSLRSSRYTSHSSTLGSVGDLNCVYFVNGDAYVNNGSGTPIQITDGTVVNVTTTNNFSSLSLAVNHTINASDTYVVFNYTGYSAAKIVTLPLASSVQSGRFYFIKDQSGVSSTYNITVNVSGGDTVDGISSYLINHNHSAVLLMSDGASNWQVYPFNSPTFLKGAEITIEATAGDVDIQASNNVSIQAANQILMGAVDDINIEAIHNLILYSTNDTAHQVGRDWSVDAGRDGYMAFAGDFEVEVGDDAAIYAQDDIVINCGNNGGGIATANLGMASTGATGAITLSTIGGSITASSGDDVIITATDDVTITAGDSLTLAGKLFLPTKAVTGATYTVDTSTKDVVIFCDSSGTAISITLPTCTIGRTLIIQDVGGVAGTNNITLVRASGGDSIQGVAASYVMDANYQGVTLCAYSGSAWFIISTS